MDRPLVKGGPIEFGRSCFVGFGATILPGVTLGEHCVVGARAVVTKSVPAFSMLLGTRRASWRGSTRSWEHGPNERRALSAFPREVCGA